MNTKKLSQELESSVYSYFMDTLQDRFNSFCEEEGIDSSKYTINLTETFVVVEEK